MEHEVTLDVAQGLLPAAARVQEVCEHGGFAGPGATRPGSRTGLSLPGCCCLECPGGDGLRHRDPGSRGGPLLGGPGETYSSWLEPEQSESIN